MRNILILLHVFILSSFSFAQEFESTIYPPGFRAELSIGFNYDFLKSPLDVSFDYPKGYFGVNIPIKYSLPQSLTGNIPEYLSDQFPEGEKFEPEAYAKQYANTSIRVDVPMLEGVATFSNMQMMYLNYRNMFTIPRLEAGTGSEGDISLFLRGRVSVPLKLSFGWETMTFGYAYKLNKKFSFAFNLHRHVFTFDLKGKVDVDILGKYYITISEEGIDDYIIGGDIDYSLKNIINGRYRLEWWTPSLAVKYWRVCIISRFGMNARPHGSLKAKYSVPFFIDPETFTMKEIDLEYMTKNFDRFRNNETNDIEYSTKKPMTWKMPYAYSLVFDILPEKLSISYTKLFGNIEMGLYDPMSDITSVNDSTNYPDTLDFNFKAHIDHLIMCHVSFYSSFFNIGIYSMNFDFREERDLLFRIKALKKLKFGKGVLTPILNGGALIGAKIQVLVELDLLPLTALKTGIVYYF